ncbi:hypothetical protein AVEN_161316-1 [Araneus ventricosus]|uniref:Uncharacterized protein n=1 Tax=Araneus ventricosus TaxID=182803 RepID=A0A4Y2X2D9_ARAVE|nr:hypothetical protein AVEN_161316-1 [Araneus ventricosus]
MEMLKTLESYSWAEVFLDATTSKEELLAAGEKFVLYLHGLNRYFMLKETQYCRFLALTKKSTLRSDFDLAKLPLTSKACHQHLLKSFLQVQKWLGNKLPEV